MDKIILLSLKIVLLYSAVPGINFYFFEGSWINKMVGGISMFNWTNVRFISLNKRTFNCKLKGNLLYKLFGYNNKNNGNVPLEIKVIIAQGGLISFMYKNNLLEVLIVIIEERDSCT